MNLNPGSIRFCPLCGAPIDQALKFGKMRPYCDQCHYIHFEDPKVAVAVFVEDQGKILLVKRANDPEKGKWALPAGYVDRGEAPATAAIRETEEETGLIVTISHLIDVLFDSGNIVILYGAAVQGGALCARDDAEEACWFTAAELPPLAFRSTQILVERWQQR
ncbi:MAG: NUDIX hydrolase [Anaerolineae bacterium]|nr:NUDIX hydrolase [Anaerolineae bacterium]